MQIMLQHVSIPRPPGDASAQQARAFYADLVGLIEKPVPASIAHLDLVWFRIGEETELHVFPDTGESGSSAQHFCLHVGDIEAMRQRLIQGGYSPYAPEDIPGRPRFFCRDPFNNLVEFTQIVDDYLRHQP